MRRLALPLLLSLLIGSTLRAQDPAEGRPVSWKLIAPNILTDQKNIWLFPFHKSESAARKWLPVLAVSGVTAALVVTADPSEARYFRKTDSFQHFNRVFGNRATEIGIVAVPIALYGSGLLRKDAKTQRTAMLAGEAAVDSELVAIALKDISRRRGPGNIANGDFSDSWLKSNGSYWLGRGSFPSGHTATAFSVATVLASRYRQHKWVSYAAYGLASAVGFSRLSLSAHYASDVFFGAAVGYSISRFAVLQPE